MRALKAAAEEAQSADAVLITGRPKVFCGGLDLVEVIPKTRDQLLEFLEHFHDGCRALFAIPRPVVTSVRGGAIAGGAILLAMGDVRLSAMDSALIGVNESRIGIPFPSSALEPLRAALPPHELSRAVLAGELLSKDQAQQRGWTHELVEAEQLEARADAVAKDLATIPSFATANIKGPLRKEFLKRMDEDKTESHRVFADAWTGAEAQARLAKILESLKRKA